MSILAVSKNGIQIQNASSLTDALGQAGLDWEVDVKPVYTLNGNGEPVLVPKRQRVFRTDTQDEFEIVSNRYGIIQNRDMFAAFDKYLPNIGGHVVEAGSMRKGAVVYGVIDLGGYEVLPNDELRMRMLILNSHDKSVRLLGMPITGRFFCFNQLDADDPRFVSVKHVGNAIGRVEEEMVEKCYLETKASLEETAEVFKKMATVAYDTINPSLNYMVLSLISDSQEEAMQRFDEYMSGSWQNEEGRRQPSYITPLQNIMTRYTSGADMVPGSGMEKTVYGVYNAVNGYFQHAHTVKNESEGGREVRELSNATGYLHDAKVKAFQNARQLIMA